MAILKKIIISDFRNIAFAELSFSEGVNCICGDNGQGKTNLLDAIYYLSMTKSAFAPSDSFCIKHGSKSFSLAGTYMLADGLSSKVVITAGADGKSLKRDEKNLPRISSHVGQFPVVIISPSDTALVSESGEERRRFMNSVLCQLNPSYMTALQRYNKILQQRNLLLKQQSVDLSLLEVLDLQLSEPAALICSERKRFADSLVGTVAEYYSQLSGGREAVSIQYKSDLLRGGEFEDLSDILGRCRERDLAMKYTTAGIQKDDFVFEMDGFPIRRCGSQGQQKSFLVALKLAQYDVMRSQYGFPPVLLLDDVFDKLDLGRISNLLKLVSSHDYGQIFISDTSRERMEDIILNIAPDAYFFNTENGEFQTSETPEV